MMNIEGKYYSYKKSEGMGYDSKLRDCIEAACQCCLDNTNKSGAEKIDKPIMLLGKIQSGKTRVSFLNTCVQIAYLLCSRETEDKKD